MRPPMTGWTAGRTCRADFPRYASRTLGSRDTWAGRPSAITDPLSSTMIRSHSDMTRPMLCSMSTTVTPLSLMDLTIAASCARSSPFRPAAGSSSSSSRGELAMARASSSRRWMP